MEGALWWLLCNIFSILTLAFYSMVEMACVSVNKPRLRFYAMNGVWRSQIVQKMLDNPSQLFTTTLIGVNIATFIGSECSREFHASLGIDPDFAPLTQVILVVIFGELAPMFAARKFSEHVVLLGAPLLYLSTKLLFPFTWLIGHLTALIDKIAGGKSYAQELFLSKEELLKMVEEQEGISQENQETQEFANITASLFTLHTQKIQELMHPLHPETMLPSDATITQLRNLLKKTSQSYTPIYHRHPAHIVGIIHARDVLRASDNHRVSEYAVPPWFVTSTTPINEIIQQFRRNNQRMAFILASTGKAIGYATLTSILNQLFGVAPLQQKHLKKVQPPFLLLHEKTLSGSLTVGEFKKRYGILLSKNEKETLADLIYKEIGHHPNAGDSVIINNYKMTVKSTSLLTIQTVTVSSLI